MLTSSSLTFTHSFPLFTVRFWEAMVCLDCGADWIMPHSYSCPHCGGIGLYNARDAKMPFGKT
jgi:hypothetical protein